MKKYTALICGGALCLGLSACTGANDAPSDRFFEWGESENYRCVDTVPPNEGVESMVTCTSGDDEAIMGVFDSEENRDMPGAFLKGDSSVEAAEGEWWVITGSSQEIIDSAAGFVEDAA